MDHADKFGETPFLPYKPDDIGYLRFLRAIHERYLFDWYLEVGCRKGHTFAPVRSKTIAVDPFFRVETNVIQEKPALHIFQQTSDAFFDSNFLHAAGIKLSFSFLDGMHLIEYLLRDFINAERNSAPSGVIGMHDCCPYNHLMTVRDWKETQGTGVGAWTGDVWKIIPILLEHRPDLTITALGSVPTGLIFVSGLDPQNTVLSDRFDQIIADCLDVSLESFGVDRFYGLFDYTRVDDFLAQDTTVFDAASVSNDQHKALAFVSP